MRTKFLVLAATCLVSSALLAAEGKGAPTSSVIAKVNEEKITSGDLKAQFVKVHGGHAKFLAGEEEVRKFLDKLVDLRLLIQEAYRLGLQDQDEVKKATDQFEEQKALDWLVKSEIEDKAKPTKEEIRAVWERATSELVKASQIVTETRADAETVHLELLGGGDFDALARACSVTWSRQHGGQMPPVGWGAMDPAFERVAFALESGEIAPPFETKDGWQVVRLETREYVVRPELAKASSRIEGVLTKRKTEERKRAFSDFLFAKYHVVLADVPHTPEGFRNAAQTPLASIATWDRGGALPLREFAARPELEELAGMPDDKARPRVDDLLRQTINEPLAKLEITARNLGAVPEIADQVRHFREEMMEGILYQDYVLKDVKASDEDVRAYYEKHKAELLAPEKRHVAHVVSATREESLEVKKRLDAGEPFRDVVKSSSIDKATASMGGELGWISKKDVPPEFAGVLGLRMGEVSEPIKSKFGFHLVKVLEITPPKPLDYETSKDDLKKKVLELKRTETRALWVKKLRAAASIRVNASAVKAFAKENSVD